MFLRLPKAKVDGKGERRQKLRASRPTGAFTDHVHEQDVSEPAPGALVLGPGRSSDGHE